MTYTTEEIAYGHYGAKAYRIEMDIDVPARPLQRHIWTLDDGSVKVEEWIASIRQTPEQLLAKGWSKVSL